MRMHVQAQTQCESSPKREQPRGQIEWYTVDVCAEELSQSDIDPAHEGQRSQKVLAELPIGDPRTARCVDFK